MKRNRLTRWLKRLLLLVLMGSGLAYGYGWYRQNNGPLSTVPEFECQKVTRGDLAQTITASGELNPVTKVEISSQISGIMQTLLVDFNSPVKEGQVVAKLDAATYEANVIIADGNLSNAKAELELARISEERARKLRKDNLNPMAEYDLALAQLHKAEAAVQNSEGSLKKAQIDLARCTIRSPIDGMVIYRNVNVGQTVAASLSAPVLMVIANDLAKMQIEANVVEADIGVVKVGQAVEFRVDAFPGEKFKGKVTQVRNAPREQMNVVVYQTIIDVSNPDLKLKPGMTATVAIIVASRDDALKVPNAALRFKPPKEAIVVDASSAGPASNLSDGKPSSAGSSTGKSKPSKKAGRTVYVVASEESASTTNQVTVLRAVEIKNGITDGRETEVADGLREGDQVVTRLAKATDRETRTFNPFAFNRW
jgi:HlyD family secretion protein